ncbi:MAG: hypothetical protein RLZZ171_2435 [Cyanobacteriota bacterium]
MRTLIGKLSDVLIILMDSHVDLLHSLIEATSFILETCCLIGSVSGSLYPTGRLPLTKL